MDLKQVLTEEQEYAVKYRGLTFYFTLRNPTAEQDFEYRRRSGVLKLKNGKAETSDAALGAPLWLLDQIKSKVEYSNGSDERHPVSPEDYRAIPPRTKLAIITRHLADMEGEEADIQKNS